MTTSNKQQQLPDIPLQYAGLWIAWNNERTRIIASGNDIAAVREAASRLGVMQPLLEKAPRPGTHYVGTL